MQAATGFQCQSLAAGWYTNRNPFLTSTFKTDKIKYAHPKFRRFIVCSSTSPPKPIQQDSPNPKQFKLHGSIAKTATLCALLSLSFGLFASEISPLSLKFAPIDNKAGFARLVEIYRRVLVIGFSLSWFLPVRHDLSKLIANSSSTSPPIPTQIPPTLYAHALSLSRLLASKITILSLKLAPILPNPNTLFFAALSTAVVHSSTGAPIAVTAVGLAWLGIYSCALLIRVFLSWLARMLELLGMYRFTFQFSHIGQQRICTPSLALQLIDGFLRLIGWLQTNDVKKVSRFQVMMGEGELKVKLVGCIGGEELVYEFKVLWEERELKVTLLGGIGGEKLVLETGLKCIGRILPNGSSEN